MAVSTDKSRDQVMAYLCGLTCECGDKPTLEEAKAYSRRFSSLIDPILAVKILGVRSWDDVLKVYHRYISGKSLGISNNPFYKQNRGSSHRYSHDELIKILKELYEEFGGEMSEQLIYERSKRKPTPSYATFNRFFGPMKNWPQVISEAEKGNTPRHIVHY